MSIKMLPAHLPASFHRCRAGSVSHFKQSYCGSGDEVMQVVSALTAAHPLRRNNKNKHSLQDFIYASDAMLILYHTRKDLTLFLMEAKPTF